MAESIYHISKGWAYFFEKPNLDKTDETYTQLAYGKTQHILGLLVEDFLERHTKETLNLTRKGEIT